MRDASPDAFIHFQKAISEAVHQADRIKELDRTRTLHFDNVSHEFRGPLTLIIEHLEYLLAGGHGSLDEPIAEEVRLVLRNSQRLHRLVNQILDLSKLDADALPLAPEVLNLSTIIQDAAEMFMPLSNRLGIDLTCEVAPAPFYLWADRDGLEKIVANLLSNAIKFTGTGGCVRLRISEEAGSAVITVSDTGTGIASSEVPRIFDRFFQGTNAMVHSHGGAGIGLALVKELVALHGGSVEAESDPGRGTTIRVRLPVTSPAEALKPEHTLGDGATVRVQPLDQEHVRYLMHSAVLKPLSEAEKYPDDDDLDRTTVLVVEDDHALRGLIRRVLEPTYRVREAENGIAALEHVGTAPPDIVIADVSMPVMDGLTLCQHLRAGAMTADIPFVFLSARAGASSHIEGMLAGADVYLTKPFESGVLWAQVGNLLARRYRLRTALSAEVKSETERDPRSALEVQVRRVIESHLSDPEFSVEHLASEVALSSSQLYRRLTAEIGVAPSDLIREIRLDHSLMLLREQRGTISEIAYASGFNSISYFGRCFRAHFGESPSEYVRLRRETA